MLTRKEQTMQTSHRSHLLAAAAVAVLLWPAPAAPQQAATAKLLGDLTLAPIQIRQQCKFTPTEVNGAPVLNAACAARGAFAGKPAKATALYSWKWALEVDTTTGRTTGNAPENGTIVLNFGKGNALYLATTGFQKPVGEASADHAEGLSTGKWTLTKGKGTYAGRKGAGTYSFSTSRTGPDTFQVAKLHLAGTIR
jgi:hypothetical protein